MKELFKKAKTIHIADFICDRYSLKPIRKTPNGWLQFTSPMRNETKPSFFCKENNWYDKGMMEGGDLIDLVCKIENCNKKDAIELIFKNEIKPITFTNVQTQQVNKVLSVEELSGNNNKSRALIFYANKRKIPFDILKLYGKLVEYSSGEKVKFAIGFSNVSGGFALRNKYEKGMIAPNNYSFIKGLKSNKLNVFEGYFDFLSALVFYKVTQPSYDTIILNGTGNIKKVYNYLENKIINYFGHNDEPDKQGKKAGDVLLTLFPQNSTIKDCRNIYKWYKDFNEFLSNI